MIATNVERSAVFMGLTYKTNPRACQRASRVAVVYADGSKPTVAGIYSITGATKSFCLKLDEFHLLVVNLPCSRCRKEFNTSFVLKHTNRCAREIVSV